MVNYGDLLEMTMIDLARPAWLDDELRNLEEIRPALRKGTRESALSCFGKWSGSVEELDTLQQEIERMRSADLDESHDPAQ